jgi:hypothetical protein
MRVQLFNREAPLPKKRPKTTLSRGSKNKQQHQTPKTQKQTQTTRKTIPQILKWQPKIKAY